MFDQNPAGVVAVKFRKTECAEDCIQVRTARHRGAVVHTGVRRFVASRRAAANSCRLWMGDGLEGGKSRPTSGMESQTIREQSLPLRLPLSFCMRC